MDAIIGAVSAMLIAAAGGSISYVLRLDRRMDELSVKIAEEYVTHKELVRLSDKLDYIIIELTHIEK